MNDASLEQNSRFMDQYSRQIGAFGIETMAKLLKLNVLIVGLKGVGIEAAKNLILAGPCSVTIVDDGAVEPKDLGSNFFLTEEDIGKRRSECCANKLADLNQLVSVRVHTGSLTETLMRTFQVVLFTNTPRKELIRWNEFCRSQNPAIGFLLCDIRGAMGYTFTDFGPEFITRDSTGENAISRVITHISREEEGIITLLGHDEDGKRHEMPDSDHDGWIEISEVEGMKDALHPGKTINDTSPWRIKYTTKKTIRKNKDGTSSVVEVFDPYRLKIGDTRHFTDYISGGMITQHKKPFETKFRSLKETLIHPIHPGDYGLMFTDGAKFGRAEQLHMAIHGLMEFEEVNGSMPKAHIEKDANEVLNYALSGPKTLLDDNKTPFVVEEIDKDVILLTSLYAEIEFQPLACFFGGVVAQEIVKFTGKFSPLKQWLHLDAFEVLPDKKPLNRTLKGSRYDYIINMFGNDFLYTLSNMKTFLVGCGALGCEYLKNFALIGLACGENGLVTVTDNDRIEVSNLNRQFLFREHNIGQPKSVAAARAVKLMNSEIQVKALEHLVAPTTEHIFNEEFWEKQDFITNALDNVKARLYVDERCVFFAKPLLESGTLGTKCNVQVILPYQTSSYSDGPKDAEDDNIPMCTLRNFPSLIEHCIEWSRAQFEDLFVVPFTDANKFLDDPIEYLDTIRNATINHSNINIGASAVSKEIQRLKLLKKTLEFAQEATFEDCLKKAYDLFQHNFRYRIMQLIKTFPEDHLTDAGEKFWTGAKRFPQLVDYDPENKLIEVFIKSTANIFAVCYGINPSPEKKLIPLDSPYRDWNHLKQIISKEAEKEGKEKEEEKKQEEEEEILAIDDEDLRQKQEQKKKLQLEQFDTERIGLEKLLDEVSKFDTSNLSLLTSIDFEKDQDLNFHIDFIYSCSNLRAFNYRIRSSSRHKCKMIAGKIIPAIATTTASVTGLAMIEMLKIIQKKKLNAFKDSSNSLGLNMYLLQEPSLAEKAKDEYDVIEMTMVRCRPSGFTKWDKTIIDAGNLTLSEFLHVFKEKTQLNCNLLFHKIAQTSEEEQGKPSSSSISTTNKTKNVSGLMLYDRNAYSSSLKQLYKEKMNMKLVDWIEERYFGLVDWKKQKFVQLETSCSDDQDEAYKIPSVVYKYK